MIQKNRMGTGRLIFKNLWAEGVKIATFCTAELQLTLFSEVTEVEHR